MRAWQPADRAPFAAMNADSRVMEHFPAPYTREQSDAFVDRIEQRWAELGYGIWAVERRATGAFIGYVGLARAIFDAPFTPAVEVGWRLAAEHWGQGFATEGGKAALEFGFGTVGLAEIVSFTARSNAPSRRVMERLGMVRDPAMDFDHPSVPEHHPVRPHVFYRITRERWVADGSRYAASFPGVSDDLPAVWPVRSS
ncbi:MAG: GNAT family N-acetyltransferase [Actinomycetota bacterium]|nr:GNAT family N-acetyltransferase [Actinomycetota bacterium]